MDLTPRSALDGLPGLPGAEGAAGLPGVDGVDGSTTANALASLTTSINVSNAAAPLAGQVLTATGGSAATWQAPTGGAATLPVGWVNVQTYGAPTGSYDDLAFEAAIAALPAAGGRIIVPAASYRIDEAIGWGNKSIFWDIDPAAIFTGTGVGVGKFPAMRGNYFQLAQGPWISAISKQPSPYNLGMYGGIAALNVEMHQPQGYKGNSVALYVGATAENTDVQGNLWSINSIINAEPGHVGTLWGYELDMNIFSSTVTKAKGMVLTGGGSTNPDTGIELSRVDWYGVVGRNWNVGIDIVNALLGIKIKSVDMQYGVQIGDVHQATSKHSILATQLTNGTNIITLLALTDSAPTGNFLFCGSRTGGTSRFVVDINGNVSAVSCNPITDLVSAIGSITKRWLSAFIGTLYFGNGTTLFTSGSGSPEGVLTAPIGSLYTRTDGGTGTTLYVKESGTGNTGWVAK